MVDMRYISLVKVRDTLNLSAFEAAHYFGNTDITEWVQWEGNRAVTPKSVTARVDTAMSRYQRFCERISELVRKGFTIKDVYQEISAMINARAEHPVLEHRIVQCALNSVLRETQAFAL